jgi:hypothetical protein
MAATLTSNSDLTFISFPIEKMETTPDGDVMVWGKATDGSVDSDEQIVDTSFSSKAIADWLSTGANVRVQHNAQRDPAGVGVEAQTDGEGATWVKSLVVEPVAKRLVEKGVLRAYSVGIARPKIVRDGVARGGRIVDGQIVEISLVDRPANKSCGIQLVKSADDGTPEWVGKVFGSDILAKAETVNVDVPANASITFSPDDLRKLLEHRKVAEERTAAKRDMDPDVGGGVDRDKIPASDFAGADRSFPIVTPKDVHDAALSLGRAKGQDTDKIKNRIIAIARRKGDAFVAQLPDAWKDDGGESAKIAKAKKKGKKGKPFPGAAPSFDGTDSDHDGVDADAPGSEEDDDTRKPPKVKPGSAKKGGAKVDATEEPEVEKGAKDCPKCGKGFHADSKLRNCDSCGADLPHAQKAASPDTETDDGDDDEATDSGKPMPVDKAGKPTPGDGVTGPGAAGVDPVPAHREPDGEAVESLEGDAGLPTTPDRSVKSADAEVMAAMRLKALGVPMDMGALHDMLCAGYHPSDVATAYPSHSIAGLDVGAWQAKALDAATGAPIEQALEASAMWQHAVTLKGTDPQEMAEIQWEAHKAFRDANPGPATFPKPTELSPRSFNRPYLSAGHAAASPGQDGPNTATVPSGQTTANSFHRPYLDAGHAADSPSNKGDAVAAPVPTGEPNRVYYRNAQRENAKQAMQAMHDHIAATFPDLCPMGGPGVGGEAPIGQRPVPVPDASKAATVEGTPVNETTDGVVAKAVTPDLIKSAVAEAVAPLMVRLDEIKQELDAERKRTKALQKAVDSLGSQPDPNVGAFKGAALGNPLLAKAAGAPVGQQPTMTEIAERTQSAMLAALQEQARHDPDPAQREAAWARIYQMTGLTAVAR